MKVTKVLLEIGFDKNNEMDFGVNCSIAELRHDQMDDFRSMICVAIAKAEDLYRGNQKHGESCCETDSE